MPISIGTAAAAQPPITTGMLVVFALVAAAFVLFVVEPVPVDVTALSIVVALIVLEPWTEIGIADGLSGFSSEATITVLAMFVISDGIRRTGAVQLLSRAIANVSGESETRRLASLIGVTGLSSGVINNTPVVAVMIPTAIELARDAKISPSRLLLPISYASMFGGMLTLIGTSTNLLASDVSARLIDRRFTMFEFTELGAIVLAVGGAYLLVVGPYLVPERIAPGDSLAEEFELDEYLTEVSVSPDSPYVGSTIGELTERMDVTVTQIVRDGERLRSPTVNVRSNDRLTVGAPQEALVSFIESAGVDVLPDVNAPDELASDDETSLVEVIVLPRSGTSGGSLAELGLGDRIEGSVLAVRHGRQVLHRRLHERTLEAGDALLVRASSDELTALRRHRDLVVVREIERPDYRTARLPIALAIVGLVVTLAALGVFPILVMALAGVVAMVVTGCVKPTEIYDAVDWQVIFLLAGVIPLGIALERTGGATFLAALLVDAVGGYSPIVVLGVFYLATGLMTEIVSNNASVVLMIPVGVDAAAQIGADPFAFVLAVTFAASTSIMTPIGYQTNLMVYGPGGYRFSDYFRVGAPLQAILVVVTTLGIAFIWGV